MRALEGIEDLPHLPGDAAGQRVTDIDPAAPQPVLLEVPDNAVLVLLGILPVGNRIPAPRLPIRTYRMGEAVLFQVGAHRGAKKSTYLSPFSMRMDGFASLRAPEKGGFSKITSN